jgi:ankyrin repeat protein
MRKIGVLSCIIPAMLFLDAGAQSIVGAVKTGDLQTVKIRIAADHSLLDTLDEKGNSLLGTAILSNQVEAARYLLDEGSDVNHKNKSGYTPLHFAADRNQVEIVDFLIRRGADVNAVNKYQITPLFSAIEKGNEGVVEALIRQGADVNFNSPYFGSPLHRAVYMDHPSIVQLLLEKGAAIEAKGPPHGMTPLQEAAMLGRLEAAGILTDHRADVRAVDEQGLTALHHAILYGQGRDGKNNSIAMAELLIGKGNPVNTMTGEGETPLFSAARQGYSRVVDLIAEHGGDIRSLSKNGSTSLLHVAAMKGYGDMVEYLLSEGLDKTLKDAAGMTALDYALKYGNDGIAVRLSGDANILTRSENATRYLANRMNEGSASIWFMNNRGWSVKTTDHLFIFDNEEAGRSPDQPSLSNGWVSVKEIRDQNVVALYSGYHALPNTMEFIHAKEDSLKQVVYFQYKEDRWRGGKNTFYLSGREIQQAGDAEIIPYETHDDYGMGSLGYLVKTKGLTFFYPNFFPEKLDDFKTEIDYLASRAPSCDFAIIEVAEGRENIYASYIIEKLKPAMVIPYDRGRNIELNKDFKKEMESKFPHLMVKTCDNPGDRIDYKRP